MVVPVVDAQARTFHIGDVLSAMTGRLLSPRGLEGLCDILSHLAGESLMTHQLPRVADEAAGPLRTRFPDLAAIVVPEDLEGEDAVRAWLAVQVAAYGETRQVAPLADVDHTSIDPLRELRSMAPNTPIIAVELDDGGPRG